MESAWLNLRLFFLSFVFCSYKIATSESINSHFGGGGSISLVEALKKNVILI